MCLQIVFWNKDLISNTESHERCFSSHKSKTVSFIHDSHETINSIIKLLCNQENQKFIFKTHCFSELALVVLFPSSKFSSFQK